MSLNDTITALGTSIINLINRKVASYVPPTATDINLGVVKPDGETITIDGNGVISSGGGLPDQTGHSGDLLTTNGTNALWKATTEVHCIIETYVNGTDWYRIYSDGWCEQGGRITYSTSAALSIPFLQPFRELPEYIDYSLVSTRGASCYVREASVNSYTAVAMNVYTTTSNGNTALWMACGYIE